MCCQQSKWRDMEMEWTALGRGHLQNLMSPCLKAAHTHFKSHTAAPQQLPDLSAVYSRFFESISWPSFPSPHCYSHRTPQYRTSPQPFALKGSSRSWRIIEWYLLQQNVISPSTAMAQHSTEGIIIEALTHLTQSLSSLYRSSSMQILFMGHWKSCDPLIFCCQYYISNVCMWTVCRTSFSLLWRVDQSMGVILFASVSAYH